MTAMDDSLDYDRPLLARLFLPCEFFDFSSCATCTHFFPYKNKVYKNIEAEIFLAISRNIHLEIYLTVRKESFHPEMQFRAIFEGG